jgi:hypothetical protein
MERKTIMSGNVSLRAASGLRPKAFAAIFYGGLTVGIFDFLFAMIFNTIRGAVPIRIFQYVASGLIGRRAFEGGWSTFVIGVLIHFFIAFTLATIYYFASLRLPSLIRKALWWGMAYGVVIHVVMNYVVIPLSAAPKLHFSLVSFMGQFLAHTIVIGPAIALIARWSARKVTAVDAFPVETLNRLDSAA